MFAEPFEQLLTGTLSSLLVWEQSRLCPCTNADGAAERTCPVCAGRGRYFEPPSDPFRAGLVGLSARALEAFAARFGPGVVGESMLSIPASAYCYDRIGEGDRITALDAVEKREWSLPAGATRRLPFGGTIISAACRVSGKVVLVPTPTPTDAGDFTVAAPTRIEIQAPSRFEVTKELAQLRAFISEGSTGLPKKLGAKRLDWTVR